LYTEKFDQAITDYEAGLKLKDGLLPRSSRQIAEAHYKLSMVLDLTSGRLGDAIMHAERALESIECRLAELASPSPAEAEAAPKADPKGKGKGKLVRDDVVSGMSTAQREGEMKELAGLKEDLALKVRARSLPSCLTIYV
jgi:HAT1-interacting factor 1